MSANFINLLNNVLNKYRFRVVFIIFSSIFLSFLEICSIRELSILINSLNYDQSINDYIISNIVNLDPVLSKTNYIILWILTLFIFKTIVFIFINYIILIFASETDVYIREIILKANLNLKYDRWIKTNSSESIATVTSFVPKIISQVFIPSIKCITDSIVLLSIMSYLMYQDLSIFLLCTFYFFIVYIFIVIVFKKKNFKYGKIIRDLNIRMIYNIKSLYDSYKEFSVTRNSNYFFDKFTALSLVYKKTFVKLNLIARLPRVLIELCFVIMFCFLFFSQKADSGSLKLLSLYGLSGLRVIPIISAYLSLSNNYKANKAVSDVVSRNFINSIKYKAKSSKYSQFKSVEFKNVFYRYDNNEVIYNFNSYIRKGDRVLLKGSSGSGKSTLVNMILSYITPYKGNILYNGQNCSLRYNTYYLPQEGFIFNDTIFENISLGSSNIKESKLTKALEDTELNIFFDQSKIDLNFILSDRGLNISGGQRQRLSICRALCSNSDLIIMDEATNALDFQSEKRILSNIFLNYPNITFIVISHSDVDLGLFNNVITL